jgi:hypothetical protein
MRVVGCGNAAGIDIVFLFFEHLPEIAVIRGFGKPFPGFDGLAVIDIAERNDIHTRAFRELDEITPTLAPCSDTGNVQLIAGRDMPATQYMAGNDKKGSTYDG